MNAWRSLILSQLRALKFFIFDYSDRPLGIVARNQARRKPINANNAPVNAIVSSFFLLLCVIAFSSG
jgi:hypothetical protein